MQTLRLTRPVVAAPVARRGRLVITNHSLWSLQPDPKFCYKNPDAAKKLCMLDLTDAIGTRRMCSVGTANDHPEDDQVIRLEHGGVHVVFEAEGTAKPLDSPSVLYVTDVDSTVAIEVDGVKLEPMKRTQLKPGAVLKAGDDVCFQVLRNVFAHA